MRDYAIRVCTLSIVSDQLFDACSYIRSLKKTCRQTNFEFSNFEKYCIYNIFIIKLAAHQIIVSDPFIGLTVYK